MKKIVIVLTMVLISSLALKSMEPSDIVPAQAAAVPLDQGSIERVCQALPFILNDLVQEPNVNKMFSSLRRIMLASKEMGKFNFNEPQLAQESYIHQDLIHIMKYILLQRYKLFKENPIAVALALYSYFKLQARSHEKNNEYFQYSAKSVLIALKDIYKDNQNLDPNLQSKISGLGIDGSFSAQQVRDLQDAFHNYNNFFYNNISTSSSIDYLKKLISGGVDVNYVNSDGNTPLMKAIQLKRRDIVELLVDSGAHLNSWVRLLNSSTLAEADDNSTLPLIKAIEQNDLDLVNYFIKSGANVYVISDGGKSILKRALEVKNINPKIIKSLKMAALKSADGYITPVDLLKYRVNIRGQNPIEAEKSIENFIGYDALIEIIENNIPINQALFHNISESELNAFRSQLKVMRPHLLPFVNFK